MSLQKRKIEKHKEELRKLTLLPGNKECMNCSVRGPMYAVLDFYIFVCTNCSAIHRSMQHKVKGISMSEFTDEEVAGLTVGGNARAARIYRHNWNRTVPREEDTKTIRDCIRQCFVDKLYFNKAEYASLRNDLDQATLPPVTTLPQGVLLGGASNTPVTTSQQGTVYQAQVVRPGTNSSNNRPAVAPHPQPQPQTQTQPQQPAVVQQQKQQQPPPSSSGLDDFFSGAPPQVTPLPTNNINAAQQQTQGLVDDFFSDIPSSRSAVSAAQQQIRSTTYSQGAPAVFGDQASVHAASHTVGSSSGYQGSGNYPQQQQGGQYTAHSQMTPQAYQSDPVRASQMLMETNRPPAMGNGTAPAPFYNNNSANNNFTSISNNNNDMGDFFSAPPPTFQQQSQWAQPTTFGFGQPTPQPGGSSGFFNSVNTNNGEALQLGRKEENKAVDAFASLDPFARK